MKQVVVVPANTNPPKQILEAENSINRKIEVMLFSGKNLELTEIFSLSSAQIQNEITKVTFFAISAYFACYAPSSTTKDPFFVKENQ